jgi:pimeloyl-ACP methyl ester carboxylesterase
MKPQVICLPGGVAPAAQRYAPLADALGSQAQLHLKDLEVYRGETPPPDYSVELELAAVDEFAKSEGLERFHLIGYSGGGFISLAYAGTRPARVESLALFEPAMVPGDMTAEERALTDAFRAKLEGLEGPELMSAFVREQLRPGVELPPSPPMPLPPAMLKRPAGIAAMMGTFFTYPFDRDRFRHCRFPVYLGYGDLTSEMEVVKAGILAGLFGDIRVQRYAGIHHFVPPERIYTQEHARALDALWQHAAIAAALSA